MIKIIGKIWNASDAYRNVTHNHIVQKKLPIQRVKKIDDDKYRSSKSSKSTKTSKASSTTKLRNSKIKMKKAVTTFNTRIEYMYNKYSDFTN